VGVPRTCSRRVFLVLIDHMHTHGGRGWWNVMVCGGVDVEASHEIFVGRLVVAPELAPTPKKT